MQRNLDANFQGDCDVTSYFGSRGYAETSVDLQKNTKKHT